MSLRVADVVVVFVCVLGGSGCAVVKHHLTQSLVADHVYERKVDDVWPEARKLVTELGYSYTESVDARGVRVLVSEWKPAFETSEIAASWTRVAVQAIPIGKHNEHCKVFFLSSTKTQGGNAVAWRQQGAAGMTLEEFQGVPAQMQRPLDSQIGGLKRAAAGPRWAGRDVGLEATFLARVDPASAHDIELDVDDFLRNVQEDRTILRTDE